MWSLFKPIQCFLEFTNVTRFSCIFIAWRLFHVDLFLKNSMQECILNVNLPYTPTCDIARQRIVLMVEDLITGQQVSK